MSVEKAKDWPEGKRVLLFADNACWLGILTGQRKTPEQGSMFMCGSVRVWRWQPWHQHSENQAEFELLGGYWELEWWAWAEMSEASEVKDDLPHGFKEIEDEAMEMFNAMDRASLEYIKPEDQNKPDGAWRCFTSPATHVHQCPKCHELERCYKGDDCELGEMIGQDGGEFEGYRLSPTPRLCFGCNRHWHDCGVCGKRRKCDDRGCPTNTIVDEEDGPKEEPWTCAECNETATYHGAWCCHVDEDGVECKEIPEWDLYTADADGETYNTILCGKHVRQVIKEEIAERRKPRLKSIKRSWVEGPCP